MPYFISDTIGTGADAEGNEIIPAIALYSDTWDCTADAPGLGTMLVRCAHLPAFDTDARIRPMRRSLLARLAPDDGETDDWLAPDLATKFARRFLLRQYLGADDFAAADATITRIAVGRRKRLREKLWKALGFDLDSLPGGTDIADVLRAVLPQFQVRLERRAMSRGGTFTDNFDGEGVSVDLASHIPSGGTAWTRVDGAVDMARCSSLGVLANNTTDTAGALYQCDDQGSANHYVQYACENVNASMFICNRASNRSNHIGVRAISVPPSKLQMFKNVAGTFIQLGSNGATTVAVDAIIRLESSGDAHEAFLAGVSQIGPVNDAHNNTITRQGVNARSSAAVVWADDFEAGTLGVGGGSALLKILVHHEG